MMTWAIFYFLIVFLYFLCLQKRNLLIGQPQGSLSESRWFVEFIFSQGDGFVGNLFSDGTSNCVGQCVNVVVNFVLSNGHLVKCGLCHC